MSDHMTTDRIRFAAAIGMRSHNAHIVHADDEGALAFDRWLASVQAEAHRDGYDTARQDLVSGAFVEGPTYEALRGSATGHKIAADALRDAAAEIQDIFLVQRSLLNGTTYEWLRDRADRIEKGES